MKSTVVATAMPTIVSQLGGLSSYSWVFSVYLLASTTTVPVYGKLSDIYGRKPVYAVAMLLFLIGSLLCGFSQSMGQLIAARAVQGLGAGGLLPLAFIIIGDLFTFEQRARMQGVFSAVWGISSVVGPLLGGFLVDQVSWHWVFFINVLPGLFRPRWSGVTGSTDRAQLATVVRRWILPGALLTSAWLCCCLGYSSLAPRLGWMLLAAGALAVCCVGLGGRSRG